MPPEETFTREERIALFRGQVETQLNFIKEELSHINTDIKELSENIFLNALLSYSSLSILMFFLTSSFILFSIVFKSVLHLWLMIDFTASLI